MANRDRKRKKLIPIFFIFQFILAISVKGQFKYNYYNNFIQPYDFQNNLKVDPDYKFLPNFKFLNQDTLSFFPRLFYSQTVLYSACILDHAFLMITDPADKKLKDYFYKGMFKKSWTNWPIDDGDSWHFNLAVHPYMGSLSYMAFRNRGGEWWSSFLITALNSAIYEYLIASSMQQPGRSDLIVTPIGGLILGESCYQIVKHFKSDNYLTKFEKVAITALDPVEVIRHRFKYRMLI